MLLRGIVFIVCFTPLLKACTCPESSRLSLISLITFCCSTAPSQTQLFVVVKTSQHSVVVERSLFEMVIARIEPDLTHKRNRLKYRMP